MAEYKEWEDLSEEEQLLQYISDTHKSAYGFRPRGPQYDNMSVEELRAELDRLGDIAERVYEEEQKREEQNADHWDLEIADLQDIGAQDRATAIKWHMQANDADWDVEHYVWKCGFLFTDRGRNLVKEIQKTVDFKSII